MAGTPKNNKRHPCNKRHSRYLGEKKNKQHSSQLTTLRALVKKNPINDTLSNKRHSGQCRTRCNFKGVSRNPDQAYPLPQSHIPKYLSGVSWRVQKPHCYYCSLPSSSTVPSTHNAPYPSPLVNKNSSTHLNK